MVIASVFAIGIMITVWFFLIPHPEMIGIYIEEMTEKEALIASASDKEIFERVIRPSLHGDSPKEVMAQVKMSQQFRRLSF